MFETEIDEAKKWLLLARKLNFKKSAYYWRIRLETLGYAEDKAEKTKNRMIDIPSEILMDWINTDNQGQRLLNSTHGIWFYERDLFDRKALKKNLKDLIKEIDKIDYVSWQKQL